MGISTSKRLTPKQSRFVQEYLIDLNATQAAIRAGYSEKTANVTGSQILVNPSVAEAIQEAIKEREDRVEISQEDALKELIRLAQANMGQFASWDEGDVRFIPSSELTEDQLACVSEISQTVTQHGGTIRLKLYDKMRALELLGKHLAMFTERLEIGQDPNKPFEFTIKVNGNRSTSGD